MGFFCCVEGPNGSGKTSLIKSLSEKGYNTLSSPNGTPLAKMLRSACRGTEPWTDIDKKVQFMLFSAARLDEYIRLVHNVDKIVFADRWWTSTYVYQVVLQGLPVEFLEHTIHPEEKVDLVVLLDGEDDVLINRVSAERALNQEHGKCRWTQDTEMMKQLIRIYREDLPIYLASKGIKTCRIDTTNLDRHMVSEKVIEIIKKNE